MAVAVYTNTVPSGAFRGYGLPQTLIAVEAAIDELARQLGISPYDMRRRNIVKPGDPMLSPPASEYHDVLYGSYGLDQCLDLVERAMQADGPQPDLSPEWLIGDGIALTMIDTVPPAGHIADAMIALRDDGGFDLDRRHRRVRQRHQHRAPADRGDGARDHGRPDPPAPVRHRPWRPRHRRLRQRRHLRCRQGDACRGHAACDRTEGGCRRRLALRRRGLHARGRSRRQRRTANVLCGAGEARARDADRPLAAHGNSGGTPRSVGFNVQGFRVAVNKGTGEIKILKSVQAADAGVVANPMQCRGQVEGGVAQALGAALYEEMVIDATGRVTNPKFRDYHLPSFADVPRTEVFFAETSDTIGPLGAKSMSESPYNPVAAALGNAIADATGIRFTAPPFKPDRLFPRPAREVRRLTAAIGRIAPRRDQQRHVVVAFRLADRKAQRDLVEERRIG